MSDLQLIRLIETLSMNAWPALETLDHDGWTLRFADGVTKRSNSVYPIHPSSLDLMNKIELCETLYRSRNLIPCFKITAAAEPPDLDSRLDALGYRRDFEVSVQLADILENPGISSNDIQISSEADEAWIKHLSRMNGLNQNESDVIRNIIGRIPHPKCAVTLKTDGAAAGCGLGVAEGLYMGLFEIVIDGAFRNRGLGEDMIRGMLEWGRRQEAETAWLQVLASNAPALRLYEKTGFKEAYRYWYRIKE